MEIKNVFDREFAAYGQIHEDYRSREIDETIRDMVGWLMKGALPELSKPI